jgi:hypothetical protein
MHLRSRHCRCRKRSSKRVPSCVERDVFWGQQFVRNSCRPLKQTRTGSLLLTRHYRAGLSHAAAARLCNDRPEDSHPSKITGSTRDCSLRAGSGWGNLNQIFVQSRCAGDPTLRLKNNFARDDIFPGYGSDYDPAAVVAREKLTSTSLRSSPVTLNMDRGLRFMKLATKTSGIWPMRVL